MEWTRGDTDPFLPEYVRTHAPARIFIQGVKNAYSLTAVWPHRMYLVFHGEVTGQHILGTLQEAAEAGLFPDDEVSALVDMHLFSAHVDWPAMVRIADIMPPGDCTTNKNAYVVHDVITASLTKINAVHFPKTTHRAFHDEAKALQWLGWK